MFLTMPWLTIELTGSATMAGLVIAVTAIPGLLLSPFMGSLVDAIGRRRMAIIVEFITAFTTFAYPLVNGFTPLTLQLLLVMGVIRALFSGGAMTARKSLLPDVAREAKKDARYNQMFEVLHQLQNQVAMQSATQEAREEYYRAAADAATKKAQLEKKKAEIELKRAELEELKLDVEIKKLLGGGGGDDDDDDRGKQIMMVSLLLQL